MARRKEGAVKGGQGDKCRAEDPNNCRFHHTGRFAQTKAALSERRERVAIPPPFDAKRAQSLLKYAFMKPMELVKYAPPELADFELKEDARKLPVAKAIAAVSPYADIFGKRFAEIEKAAKAARLQVFARCRTLRMENGRLMESARKASEEDAARIDAVVKKNVKTLTDIYGETRDLESRMFARAFSEGENSVGLELSADGVDAISVKTLDIAAHSLFAPELLCKGVAIGVMDGERSVTTGKKIMHGKYADAETLVHEYAHCVENSNSHVLERCVEFLDYRCGKEKTKMLSSFGDIGEFHENETGRKDNFFHAYCGRDYIDKNGNRVSTEILSMGIEMLLIHPQMFYERDREYFAFVVGLMKGKL